MHRRYFIGLFAAGAARCVLAEPVHPAQIAPPTADVSWLTRLPKVELHLHLEGATPKSALWEIVTKYGGDPLIHTREDLDRALVYRDFRSFLRMWVWMIGYLREYDDFTLISRAVARDLARQNIRYVEAFFSPPDFRRSALSPQRVVQAFSSWLAAFANSADTLLFSLATIPNSRAVSGIVD